MLSTIDENGSPIIVEIYNYASIEDYEDDGLYAKCGRKWQGVKTSSNETKYFTCPDSGKTCKLGKNTAGDPVYVECDWL